MRKIIFAGMLVAFSACSYAQEFLQVTTIESVVPGGMGRSRMITSDEYGKMEEIKLENLYSLVGINFGNVRENDKLITAKLNELTKRGWKLEFVTSGVDPGGVGAEGGQQRTGIFITRYLFSKGQ